MTAANVSTPASEYAERQAQWALATALMGGTRSMRAAGKAYLPKFEAEEQVAWDRRLSANVLHGGFATIVKTMAGLPFSKPIGLGDDVMPALKGKDSDDGRLRGGWIEDIDLRGNHLDIFAKRIFAEGLAKGSSHILVDMPSGAPQTAADDLKRRPRWVHIAPEQLIDARRAVVGGKDRFVHVRIKERVREASGYAEKWVDQIREIEPGAWRVWRKGEKDWAVVESGPYQLGYVALVPFLAGSDRKDFTADSPLENCAHLNVTHWQSSSDQRNVLTFSRFAMLFIRGPAPSSSVALGPMTLLTSDEEWGDAKVIEHTGAAIEAGERDLKNLEAAMEAEGLRMLVRRPGNVTATEMVIDENKDQSELEALAGEFSDALELAAEYTAAWMGLPEGSGGSISVNKNFGIVPNADKIMATVLKLREAGDLSAEDSFRELQRAGLLSDDLNIEDALERAANDLARTMAAAAAISAGSQANEE